MCGIFGYIGKKNNAGNFVLDGLKLLEYRGYDSWGITVKNGEKLVCDKRVGKIGDAKISLPESILGIGHTRWATHGGVTMFNAHPHLDCKHKIAVIHNGIVENYEDLKKKLVKKGHIFKSETDTEVIVHLIEENLKKESSLSTKEKFISSVKDAFNRLEGLNAIVVISSTIDKIIAAKIGSPLVVGKKNSELFIASDASGIIKHTKELLFVKDKEMVILGDKVELFSLPKGEKIEPVFETINWKLEDATRGKYKHFMLKEIYEQSKVIRNINNTHFDQIQKLAEVIDRAFGTFLIGAGTAYHACLAGSYLFSKIAHKHVNTALASEFNYLEDFLTKDSLIVALSQSGETIDVIEPLSRAKEKGSKIMALVNTLGSTIYRMSDYKLLLGAGPEKAVASTKAYIAKITVLLMLSLNITKKSDYSLNLLKEAANEVERLLKADNIKHIKKLAKKLKNSEHIYTIGRGISYPTALEAALKIKEVSYIHTEGLAGGELKHGTIALISKGTPCIIFAPFDETYDSIVSNATEIKARGGYIIGISPQNSSVFDYFIEVKDVKEAVIIAQIIPAQLLGYFLAVQKNLDPDKPRNLAKSVTVK